MISTLAMRYIYFRSYKREPSILVPSQTKLETNQRIDTSQSYHVLVPFLSLSLSLTPMNIKIDTSNNYQLIKKYLLLKILIISFNKGINLYIDS